MRPKVLFICGPTAVGKTSHAIALAQWLEAEIFSFDSRQFYRELKIGSASPSTAELEQVPHHFIANRSVTEPISAGDYEKLALAALSQYFKKKEVAVLVGGSGLYMKALSEGFDDFPTVPAKVRRQWQKIYAQEGLTALQKALEKRDPLYFNQVDQQNPQRLMRALEIIESSGRTFSSLRKKIKKQRPFDAIKIGLNCPREVLYARINERVNEMMQAGLLAECQALWPHRHENALQTVGYRELFEHLSGQCSLDEAVEKIKQNSRRYAKRQLTWFRRDQDLQWFEAGNSEAIKSYVKTKLP